MTIVFSKWLDLINNQRVGKDIHETFHRKLDSQQDKFGVIAEFLGRRLFDKVKTFLFFSKNSFFLFFS
jgi:hypothetical protein